MKAARARSNPCGRPPLQSADKTISVQLKNSHYPTPARASSLQDAVLELVRRYEGSFGRKLFASGAEACAAVAAELARPPWAVSGAGSSSARSAAQLARRLRCGVPARCTSSDAAYQAHVATCQQAPTHAKALQSALLLAPASKAKAPTRGAAGGPNPNPDPNRNPNPNPNQAHRGHLAAQQAAAGGARLCPGMGCMAILSIWV